MNHRSVIADDEHVGQRSIDTVCSRTEVTHRRYVGRVARQQDELALAGNGDRQGDGLRATIAVPIARIEDPREIEGGRRMDKAVVGTERRSGRKQRAVRTDEPWRGPGRIDPATEDF